MFWPLLEVIGAGAAAALAVDPMACVVGSFIEGADCCVSHTASIGGGAGGTIRGMLYVLVAAAAAGTELADPFDLLPLPPL